MANNSSDSGYQRTGEGFETPQGCPGSGKLTFVTEGLGNDSVDLSSGFAIPLHLVTYTLVTLVSLLIYWARLHWGWEVREQKAPSFFSMLLAREDSWMRTQRGQSSLDYLLFQRLLLAITLLLQIFSLVAMSIHYKYGGVTPISEFYNHEDYGHWNLTVAIAHGSFRHMKQKFHTWYNLYHIIVSALMPWLFWAAARILLPPCPPHSEEQSSTVVINGLDPKEHTTTAIRCPSSPVLPTPPSPQEVLRQEVPKDPAAGVCLGQGHSLPQEAPVEVQVCPGGSAGAGLLQWPPLLLLALPS